MTGATPSPISPDTVTTRQLVGGLTPKHWKSAITGSFTAFAAVAYGGFWMGQHLAEAKAETQAAKAANELAVMESRIGEAKAELKAASARISQLVETNASWQTTHQATLGELARQQQEILSLSTALGKASNCTFIHEQIRAINIRMQSTGSPMVFSDSDEWQGKQAERRSALQSQLAAYQQQLGNCNK